ncbi:putative 50S ribosomal protein L28 [Candidatus Tremblaya princeps PCIT]|uniref:Putative 50S ribosomal protein L28 n=1 Tax=Tremblaya princeps (strain PCIT) TaxID=891398 RepID=F7XYG6_TREPP|nr:putative 50S ribosomal protein L28 [Candidatus Tremblaya princeps PCIT]AEK38422.1 50S ribosomal protein L28 [Candidatus Tremblaya princeps PCVAL]
MTLHCDIAHKAHMLGNTVSHAQNKARRRFMVNSHRRWIWCSIRRRLIRAKLSCAGLRTYIHAGMALVNV